MKTISAFCAAMCLAFAAHPSDSESTGGKGTPGGSGPRARAKWHPGHYMLVANQHDQSMFDSIFASEEFQGVQARYYWSELEPEKDAYDFSKIESDLAYLEKRGKRLFVQLMYRGSIRDGAYPVPSYILKDPEYHGGVEMYKGDKPGCLPRLWDPAVNERICELVRRLGARFDAEPYFEGVNFPESAVSIDRSTARGFSNKAHAEGVKSILSAARTAFPETVVIQYVNWMSGDAMKDLVDFLYRNGLGMGGPDIRPDEVQREGEKRVASYFYYEAYAGKMPLAAAAQTPEFSYHGNRQKKGQAGPFTPEQIYAMGMATLNLNYFFWMQVGGPPAYICSFDDIIAFVKSRKGSVHSAIPKNLVRGFEGEGRRDEDR